MPKINKIIVYVEWLAVEQRAAKDVFLLIGFVEISFTASSEFANWGILFYRKEVTSIVIVC